MMSWIQMALALLAAAMLAAAGGLGLLRRGVDPLRPLRGLRRRSLGRLLWLALFVVCAVHQGATKFTNGLSGASSPQAAPPLAAMAFDDDEPRPVTNLCCTAINVSSNAVELVYAWPEDYFAPGDILDLFASTNLAAPCEWAWHTDHSIAEGETNWTEQVDLADFAAGSNPPPAALFFKVALRVLPDDLRDSDGDGLPDVYEFHNGTHPHIKDYERAPRRVVVDSVSSLRAALADSCEYTVVELDGSVDYDLGNASLDVPEWPVMVWCRDGYATIRSTGVAAFKVENTVCGDSLFENLYLSLEANGGFQAGFWMGPGWVMNGTNSAAANFENIYIRMPNAGTEYFGWHYYRANENVSRFERCVVNATGSDWAHGIYSYDGPTMDVEGCTFMGFSSSGRNSFGVYLESSRDNLGGMSGETAVSIRNCVFDEGFTNAHCHSFISSEKGTNYLVRMESCLVPNGFVPGQDPDVLAVICHTNVGLAAYGFPQPDSLVARMGLGALSVLSPSDVTDRDGDGLTDYAEAYVHGTDPWLRDSDYDGVDDFTELDIDHTDPLNVNSFVRRVAVTLTNRVVHAGVTNYVAFGNSAHGWETNGVVWSSTGAFASNCFDEVSLNGAGYARAYQDLNRNGVYDAAADILLVSPLPVKSLAKVAFSFGDVDGDGVADDVERMEGTDPYDGKNFKVSFAVEISGVFHTTNNLSVGVFMNGQMQYGPEVVTTNVWRCDADCVVSNGMTNGSFRFWDDADSNGVCNVTETYVDQYFTVKNGRVAVTNRLSYGNFDRDRDNLPDWWEVTHGLSDNGPKSDEYSDPDEDGLINLHEYWAGTNPQAPDGSNTLLSACARSIDGRINVNVNNQGRMAKFLNYRPSNGGGYIGKFIVNTNCWIHDVDTSCASMWNSFPWPGEFRKAGTLISPRHMIFAKHFPAATNQIVCFMGVDGISYTNMVVAISNVDDNIDIQLALLKDEMPTNVVTPAYLLPTNFYDYVGTGRMLPVLKFDYDENAAVLESKSTFPDMFQISSSELSITFDKPKEGIRLNYYDHIVVGDSGNPVFLLVGNKAVLLGCFHSGYISDGDSSYQGGTVPFVTRYAEDIQRIMDGLCPGYSLRFLDCSGFDRLSME